MTTRHISALSGLAAALFATTALADGLTYANVTLTGLTDGDDSIGSLIGDIDYSFGAIELSVSGGGMFGEGYDLGSVAARIGYRFGAVTPYLFTGAGDFGGNSITGLGLGIDYTGANFGVMAEYADIENTDTYHVGGYYSFGRTTVLAGYNDIGNFEALALGIDYQADRLGLTLVTNWDPDSFSNGLTAMGASYDMGRYDVFASVLTSNDDFLADGYITLGAGYDISERYSVEASYTDGFGGASGMDGMFGLNLTYELGGARTRVADQLSDHIDNIKMPMMEAFGSKLLRP